MENHVITRIREAGSKLFGVPPDKLFADDLTDSYEWVRSGRIGEVATKERHSRTALLLVDNRGVR